MFPGTAASKSPAECQRTITQQCSRLLSQNSWLLGFETSFLVLRKPSRAGLKNPACLKGGCYHFVHRRNLIALCFRHEEVKRDKATSFILEFLDPYNKIVQLCSPADSSVWLQLLILINENRGHLQSSKLLLFPTILKMWHRSSGLTNQLGHSWSLWALLSHQRRNWLAMMDSVCGDQSPKLETRLKWTRMSCILHQLCIA